ncbi:hypothetical protein ACFPT7_22355 [Acidicapsa dinghuensis]|uniref:Transposase n=1 Tax=Acidicapsa dinghuensis TaxID=2218256 RepID=A0ABW1ELW8_9BACT|nr:hypothetical protein [Acidicapsa dinghuensis]
MPRNYPEPRGITTQANQEALDPAEKMKARYEAGATGYVVYRQLARLGVHCEVVASRPVPIKAGN